MTGWLVVLGWVLAAWFCGVIVGVAIAIWWMQRHPVAPRLVPQPPQPAATATVYAPVEPEALAQQLLNDDVQQRMIEDFQQSYGATLEDAKLAVAETLAAARRLGATNTW